MPQIVPNSNRFGCSMTLRFAPSKQYRSNFWLRVGSLIVVTLVLFVSASRPGSGPALEAALLFLLVSVIEVLRRWWLSYPTIAIIASRTATKVELRNQLTSYSFPDINELVLVFTRRLTTTSIRLRHDDGREVRSAVRVRGVAVDPEHFAEFVDAWRQAGGRTIPKRWSSW